MITKIRGIDMLNSNYGNNPKKLILLGKNYCRTDVGNSEESVYSSSEALSNHISNNILESLRQQLIHKGLNINVDADEELDTVD